MTVNTSIVFAAPSVIASGQEYNPDDGENRYSLATWKRRLKHIIITAIN